MYKLLFTFQLAFVVITANAQWIPSQITTTNSVIIDGSFYNSNTVGFLDQNGKFFLSIDKGVSFESKLTYQGFPGNHRFQLINDSSYLIVYSNTNSYFKFTSDYGNTWSDFYLKDANLDTIKDIEIILAHFWENGNAMVIAKKMATDSCNRVYISNDNGTTWSLNDCSSVNESAFSSMGLRFPRYVFEDKLIMKLPISTPKILIISEYGKSFKEIALDTDRIFTGMAFKDSLNGILYFDNNTVYRTVDGGKNLIQISSPTQYSPILSYAKPTQNSPKGFYIAAGNDGVYASYDNGDSWENIDNNKYQFVNFRDADLGIAYFQDIGILGPYQVHFTNKLNLNLPTINGRASFIKTYPNPSHGNFTIELEESASIQIYSTTGTLMYNDNLEKGVQNISLPNLANGLYILKAEGINFHQSLRVVIE